MTVLNGPDDLDLHDAEGAHLSNPPFRDLRKRAEFGQRLAAHLAAHVAVPFGVGDPVRWREDDLDGIEELSGVVLGFAGRNVVVIDCDCGPRVVRIPRGEVWTV